jgi:HEAT repeat protein
MVLAFLILAVTAGLLHAQGAKPTPATKEPAQLDKIGGKALEQWVDDLKHADPSIRETALQTIPLFGSAARKAAPAIIDRLADGDASVRVYAAIAIGVIPVVGPDQTKAVEALTKRITYEEQGIARFHVIMALGQFGPDAKAAIPGLLNTVRDRTSWEIRKASVFALGRAAAGGKDSPPDQRAFAALTERLNTDPSFQVRLEATIVVCLLGPPTNPLELKALDTALNQRIASRGEDEAVKIWAHMALMALHKIDEPHLVAIAKFLKSPKVTTRTQAIRAFGEIGPLAQSRVPDLINLLEDEEPLVVAAACWALSEMGPAAQKAERALTDVAEKHKDEVVKKAAKEALTKIKGKPKN